MEKTTTNKTYEPESLLYLFMKWIISRLQYFQSRSTFWKMKILLYSAAVKVIL